MSTRIVTERPQNGMLYSHELHVDGTARVYISEFVSRYKIYWNTPLPSPRYFDSLRLMTNGFQSVPGKRQQWRVIVQGQKAREERSPLRHDRVFSKWNMNHAKRGGFTIYLPEHDTIELEYDRKNRQVEIDSCYNLVPFLQPELLKVFSEVEPSCWDEFLAPIVHNYESLDVRFPKFRAPSQGTTVPYRS